MGEKELSQFWRAVTLYTFNIFDMKMLVDTGVNRIMNLDFDI